MTRYRPLHAAVFTIFLALMAGGSLQAAGPKDSAGKAIPMSSHTVIGQHMPLPNEISPESGTKFQEPRESYRSFYVDLAAAVFGWLAVVFAMVTVGFAIVGIREFRDVKRKIEQELRTAIHTQLNERIQELTEQTIRPKIQSVLEEELKRTLDKAVVQFDEELKKSLQSKEFTARLMDTVTDEIKARLSKPQTPGVNAKEFEPQ